MTNQEFIDNLSTKAKAVLTTQYKRRTNKSIKIYLDDEHTRVITDNPTSYIIFVKRRKSFYDMEYSLLHEFFHCIQIEEGFPNVNYINKKYQNIAATISTVILDLDVYDRLLKIGYHKPSYFNNTFSEFKDFITMISQQQKIFIPFVNQLEQRIEIVSKTIILQKVFGDNNLVKVVNTIKTKFPLVYNDYDFINNTIQSYGYSTSNNAYNSFNSIIKGLKLEEYISIVT